jgi:hypothetical protein
MFAQGTTIKKPNLIQTKQPSSEQTQKNQQQQQSNSNDEK